jgi:hypothetical protein
MENKKQLNLKPKLDDNLKQKLASGKWVLPLEP